MVYNLVHTVNKQLQVLFIAFPDGKQVIISIEMSTRLFLHVNSFQYPHIFRALSLIPLKCTLRVGSTDNINSFVCQDLVCFEFILFPFLVWYTDCRGFRCARNDESECLSTISSLHVTTPSVVVGGVEFVKR